jgi:S1-C subfamily serine protease
VAGSSAVRVETPGGSLSARVVVYDPEVDVAVLSVNGLSAPALSFAQQPAATGDDAIVLGYPEDGPFNVQPARIRERGEITGRDIYGDNTIRREIYSIRGTVRSGNSGGPLISGTGTVLGMVFATALDSTDTGFVLTDAQISGDANAGLSATAAVSTQTCD